VQFLFVSESSRTSDTVLAREGAGARSSVLDRMGRTQRREVENGERKHGTYNSLTSSSSLGLVDYANVGRLMYTLDSLILCTVLSVLCGCFLCIFSLYIHC